MRRRLSAHVHFIEVKEVRILPVLSRDKPTSNLKPNGGVVSGVGKGRTAAHLEHIKASTALLLA